MAISRIREPVVGVNRSVPTFELPPVADEGNIDELNDNRSVASIRNRPLSD